VYEKRRFQRIPYKARSLFDYLGQVTEAQVETISLNGAMVSFDDSVMVPEGESCVLAIFPEGEELPIRLSAEVVFSTMYRVGLHFIAYQDDAPRRLCKLMKELTLSPEKLREESILLGWAIDEGC
jgi:hypothetical protein